MEETSQHEPVLVLFFVLQTSSQTRGGVRAKLDQGWTTRSDMLCASVFQIVLTCIIRLRIININYDLDYSPM